MAELAPVPALAAVAALFGAGVGRELGRGALRHPRSWCFAAGLLAASAALVGPLPEVVPASLPAHMVQHVTILVAAAPLLVMSRPLTAMVSGLPRWWRARVRPPADAVRAWARRLPAGSTIAGAVVLHTAITWIWHAPPLYDAAVRSDLWHALEHGSYLTAGLLLWATVLAAGRSCLVAVLALFATALPGTALGAALAFSRSPWYAGYPSVGGQQLAGAVMWSLGGAVYALAAGALVAAFLRREGAPEGAPGAVDGGDTEEVGRCAVS